MIIILMTLEVSFMLLESSITLLEKNYSTGVTYDDRPLQLSHFNSTGQSIVTISKTMLNAEWRYVECQSEIQVLVGPATSSQTV